LKFGAPEGMQVGTGARLSQSSYGSTRSVLSAGNPD
jgi:hypothetical protein